MNPTQMQFPPYRAVSGSIFRSAQFQLMLLAILPLLLTGCMSYRGDKLAKLPPIQKAQEPAMEKVRVDLQVMMNGQVLSGPDANVMREQHSKLMSQALNASGLFRTFSVSGAGAPWRPGEYLLKYSVNDSANLGAVAASSFICGFTLLVIPGFATDHFSVQAELINPEGKSVWVGKYEEDVSLVIWIGFFPCLFAPPLYSSHVVEAVMKDIYHHSFEDMTKQGAIGKHASMAR